MDSDRATSQAKATNGPAGSAGVELRAEARDANPPSPSGSGQSRQEGDAHREHAQANEAPAFNPEPLTAYTYFFVRGHPRSGTNWVGRLLNLHPQINCQGEYHFQIFQNALRSFCARPHQLGARKPVRPEARKATHDLIRRCMRATAEKKPGAMLLGDRTPSDVRMVLPNSRTILVIRDGRDVLVSFTLHNLRGAGFQMDREPFKTELAGLRERFAANPSLFVEEPGLLLGHEGWVRHAARSWAQRAVSDLAQGEKMALEDGSPAMLEVRYELLHDDVEAQRLRMYEFMGVDGERAIDVSDGEDTRPGLAREEEPGSLRRKGVVGDWARYFNDDVRRWFKDEAQEVLEKLGYEHGSDW